METGIPVTLLFSIIGALILGLVVMLMMKINSNEKACEEKFKNLEKSGNLKHSSLEERVHDLEECEKKNYSFRHNFDTITKGMMHHFETKFENLEKLMEGKFDVIIKALQGKDK